MNQKSSEMHKQIPANPPVMMAALILGLIGWIGLALLILLTVPTLGPRWLLFFLTTLAFSGPALPIAQYLHKRFPSKPATTSGVLVREAIMVGVYVDTLLWLQFGKVLNFALAVFIAVGLIAIELLIRWRERTTWTPPSEE